MREDYLKLAREAAMEKKEAREKSLGVDVTTVHLHRNTTIIHLQKEEAEVITTINIHHLHLKRKETMGITTVTVMNQALKPMNHKRTAVSV